MRLAAIILFLVCTSGCCVTHYATADELVAYAHRVQSEEPRVQNLLHYQGSEDGYDYFKYAYGMAAERCFVVRSGEVTLPRWFARTPDSTRWI